MSTPPFDTLLVANRGEIARRIMRTARRLGIRTVAVYSEADAEMPFVREADEAHLLGPAPPKDSYLRADKILAAAKASGAGAIHPGYGFLAEDPGFAEAVRGAGLAFVGPSADAMRKLGDKLAARELARAAGVPVIPGGGPVRDLEEAKRLAAELGYPVMVKPAGGGGGIGLVRVDGDKRLERALEDAAKKGSMFFADARVYLEKALERPCHVEVQVLADRAGSAVALGERDCTVQRRNQKLVEETPSPRVSPSLRERMFEAALSLVRAAGYENAGTVELLLEGGTEQFYFLEVNSRLQVEHPVTELVTGLDLVEAQLRLAAGRPLDQAIARVEPSGHSIEVRICAEDPEKRFFPSPGTISELVFPSGVRVDSGVDRGSVVSPSYDSLIAKMVVRAEDRDLAIQRMLSALEATKIEGIRWNQSALLAALSSDAFRRGEHDTSLLASLGFKS